MAALVDAEPVAEKRLEPERLHVCYEGRETFEVAIDPPKSWRYGPVVGRDDVLKVTSIIPCGVRA